MILAFVTIGYLVVAVIFAGIVAMAIQKGPYYEPLNFKDSLISGLLGILWPFGLICFLLQRLGKLSYRIIWRVLH